MGIPCWKRFLWECRPSYPFYSLEEASIIGDNYESQHGNNNDKRHVIDVAASFAPSYKAIPIRLFFLCWSLQVLYTDVSTYPPHNLYIYMGYLTHWGHLLSNCYFIGSFLCSILPWAVQQPQDDGGALVPGRLVRFTWGLYSCVAPLEIAITMLYWSGATFLSGHGCYVAVMEHGGIATLILLDGLVVGLVPVRAKHVIYLLIVSVSYMAWSVIDAVFDIGNGEWGPAYEDDALYPVLNWNDDRNGAEIVCAFVICILSPCLFYGCWALSLLKTSASKSAKIVIEDDMENDIISEGSIARQQHGCFCCANFDGSRRPLYNNGPSTSAPGYIVMEDFVVV